MLNNVNIKKNRKCLKGECEYDTITLCLYSHTNITVDDKNYKIEYCITH